MIKNRFESDFRSRRHKVEPSNPTPPKANLKNFPFGCLGMTGFKPASKILNIATCWIIAGICLAVFPGPLFPAGISPPSPTDEGRALLKSRAYHLAMERFLLVQEKSENYIEKALALRLIGETQFHEKDYTAAYQAYQQSLRLNPITSGALGLAFKSAVSLVYLKNYPTAIDQFKELEKRAYEMDTLCDLYFWEAECYFQLEQYDEAGREYGKILDNKPDYRYADMVRYLQAWCYFQQKDYTRSLESFSKVLEKTTDETLKKLTLFQVAETQFRMEKYTDAKKNYQTFLKQYPKDFLEVPALYGLGWTFEKLKNPPEAIKTFESIVTDFPSHLLAPWAAVREGAEAYQAEDHDKARQAYTKGLELAAGKAPADLLDYGLGWLDYSDQKYDAAARHFLNVSNFQPQSGLYWDAQYLLAGCEYLETKYDDAKAIYGRIALKAPSEVEETAAYWRGWCDYALGHYDFSLEEFKKVAETSEGDLKARADWASAESAYEMKNYADAAGYYQKALKDQPSPGLLLDCYSGLGWSYFQQEKYQEAVEAFQNAVRQDPSAPLGLESQLRTGDCYYNLHDYPKAENAYRSLVDNHAGPPTELDAQEQIGWCAYRQEKFSDAINTWGALLKKSDTDNRKSRLIYWTAWAYFRLKDFDHASSEFKEVETDYPKDPLAPESHLREADCLFNLQRFKDSKDTYQSFLDNYPDNPLLPDALYGLQWSAEKLGEKETSSNVAKQFLEKFPNSPFASSVQYRMAEGLFHDEKFDDAIQAYKDLLAKYPDSSEAPRALFWMGTALVKIEKNDNAIPVFQELLKKYPSDPLALEGQFSLGSVYFETGKFQDALDAYTDIFTHYPDHRLATHALFNSAVCEKQLKHNDKALAYFQKLLKDYGNDPLAIEAGLQAGLLLEKTGKPEEALKAYEITMASPETSLAVEASFYHADLLKQLKKYDDSRREFNHLIVKYPSEDQWVVTAFAKIAETYEEQKDYPKAEESYKRILKYTKIPAYRNATYKRLKALQPFLKKKSEKSSTAVVPSPSGEATP